MSRTSSCFPYQRSKAGSTPPAERSCIFRTSRPRNVFSRCTAAGARTGGGGFLVLVIDEKFVFGKKITILILFFLFFFFLLLFQKEKRFIRYRLTLRKRRTNFKKIKKKIKYKNSG